MAAPIQSKLKTSSVTVIISLALVLFLLGLVGWIFLNARSLINHFKENIAVQVFLKEEASAPDAERLKKVIDAAAYTKTAVYTTKEEALEIYKARTGDDASLLDFNPLPSSININLRAEYANPDSIAWIEKEIASDKSVHEVVYQKVLIDNVSKNARKISLIILIFSAVLIVIAITLINNTIRLSIYAKRFLIRTMYLVGATQGFIRKPFIIKGIVNGIIAGIVADILIVLAIVLLSRFIPELLVVQNPNLLAVLFLITILVGILISGLSTALSVRRYLRLKADDLYF